MADEEYVSFENALRDLQISADQLKRLVSEGEIRAIRGLTSCFSSGVPLLTTTLPDLIS